MYWSFLHASQVLIQGCLLDPSQREVFLQQVYAQLCLFEDKVATMLQQQYDPQSQVCEDKVGRGHLERAAMKEQRGEWRGKPNTEGKEIRKKDQRQSEPGLEVLVSTHDRFPIGRRARILFPEHRFLLKKMSRLFAMFVCFLVLDLLP